MVLVVKVIDLRDFDGTKEHYDKLYAKGKYVKKYNVTDVSKAMDELRREYPAGQYDLDDVSVN